MMRAIGSSIVLVLVTGVDTVVSPWIFSRAIGTISMLLVVVSLIYVAHCRECFHKCLHSRYLVSDAVQFSFQMLILNY